MMNQGPMMGDENPGRMGIANKLAATRGAATAQAPAATPAPSAAIAEQVKPLLASMVKTASDIMAILDGGAAPTEGA